MPGYTCTERPAGGDDGLKYRLVSLCEVIISSASFYHLLALFSCAMMLPVLHYKYGHLDRNLEHVQSRWEDAAYTFLPCEA